MRIKQGDASARFLEMHLMQGTDEWTPESGVIFMFRCEKPDKTAVVIDSEIEDAELHRKLLVVSGNVLTLELIDQISVAVGKCKCDICMTNDGQIISTIPFIIDVFSSPDITNIIESEDDYRTVQNALSIIAGIKDGFSPIVTVTDITDGHRITITDKDGTKTFDVMDGADGENGRDGSDGRDGTDGFSPTVSVTSITGGHRITVTDENGTQSFDIIDGVDGVNGRDGENGVGVPTGGTQGQYLSKVSGTDYDTTWSSIDWMVPKIGIVTVLADGWSGKGPYTQTISIPGGTTNSKIDMQLSSDQIAQLFEDGVTAMLIGNNNGVFTIYANDAIPSINMNIQITITETLSAAASSSTTENGSDEPSSDNG